MIAVVGVLIALVFLCYGIYKGINPVVASIIAALFVMVTNGMPIQETWEDAMGTVGYVMGLLAPLWIMGGIMGTVYMRAGAMRSISDVVGKYIFKCKGEKKRRLLALIAIMVINLVVGMSGVDAAAIQVMMVLISLSIFEKFNLPNRFLPATLLSSAGAVLVTPGTPQVTCVLLEEYVEGFDNSSMLGIRFVLLGIYCVLAVAVIYFAMEKAIGRGETYEKIDTDEYDVPDTQKTPHWILAVIPILVIFAAYSFLDLEAWLSLLLGLIVTLIIYVPYLYVPEGASRFSVLSEEMSRGAFMLPLSLLMMMLPMNIISEAQGMDQIIDYLVASPIPLAAAFVIISLIFMGFSGSAGVAILAPIYTEMIAPQGVLSAMAVGIIVSWSITVFNTLPTNNGILIQCKLSHTTMEKAYPTVFETTVLLSLGVTVFVAALASLGVF